jgi:hypothetical protein
MTVTRTPIRRVYDFNSPDPIDVVGRTEVVWACPQCGAEFQKHGTGSKARSGCKFPPDEKHPCMGFRCYCRADIEHSHAENKNCPKAHCACCWYLGPFTGESHAE